MDDETDAGRRTELARRCFELFLKEGVSAQTMEGLATRVGVSKRTLYKYFRNKEDLAAAAVETMFHRIVGLLGSIESAEMSFPERLAAFFSMLEGIIRPATTVMARDMMANAPWLWDKIETFRRETIFPFLEALILEGRERGFVRDDVDSRLVTPIYLAAIEQVVRPELLMKLPFSLSEVVDTVITILLGGILSDAGRKLFADFKQGACRE